VDSHEEAKEENQTYSNFETFKPNSTKLTNSNQSFRNISYVSQNRQFADQDDNGPAGPTNLPSP